MHLSNLSVFLPNHANCHICQSNRGILIFFSGYLSTRYFFIFFASEVKLVFTDFVFVFIQMEIKVVENYFLLRFTLHLRHLLFDKLSFTLSYKRKKMKLNYSISEKHIAGNKDTSKCFKTYILFVQKWQNQTLYIRLD